MPKYQLILMKLINEIHNDEHDFIWDEKFR